MAPPPERPLPSSRARRWRVERSRSMRPSLVSRAEMPVRPAGRPPSGMALNATLSPDGPPVGVAVGVFVQHSPVSSYRDNRRGAGEESTPMSSILGERQQRLRRGYDGALWRDRV